MPGSSHNEIFLSFVHDVVELHERKRFYASLFQGCAELGSISNVKNGLATLLLQGMHVMYGADTTCQR